MVHDCNDNLRLKTYKVYLYCSHLSMDVHVDEVGVEIMIGFE
jgi:hypothetical protein